MWGEGVTLLGQLGEPAIPSSLLGTLIFCLVSLLGVVVWIVKKQFENQEKMTESLTKVSLSLERVLTHLRIKE